MQTRRTALLNLAAATVTPLLAETPATGHHMHDMEEQTPAPLPVTPNYFSPADYETVSKFADLIIPRSETAGAIDAGVPHQIDRRVSLNPELQERFRQGLAPLTAQNFATLPENEQIALLQSMSAAPETQDGTFFKTMKDMTVDAYYSSEPGLVKELGYKGNTFRASFPGCTHPEHWPATPEHASDNTQR